MSVKVSLPIYLRFSSVMAFFNDGLYSKVGHVSPFIR